MEGLGKTRAVFLQCVIRKATGTFSHISLSRHFSFVALVCIKVSIRESPVIEPCDLLGKLQRGN